MLVPGTSSKLKLHLKKYELNSVTLFRNKTKRSFAKTTKFRFKFESLFRLYVGSWSEWSRNKV